MPKQFNHEGDIFLRKRIKELRLKANLTQETFAEMAGFSPKVYQSIEAGRRGDIRLKTVYKIARGFGLEVHELFAPETPKPKMRRKSLSSPHNQKKK